MELRTFRSLFSAGGTVRGARIKHLRPAASPVVINFHPLPRGNVSITRQPQPGCLQLHQTMSRDHVIVIDLRKQKKKPAGMRVIGKPLASVRLLRSAAHTAG